MQRRVANPEAEKQNKQPYPVTLIRQTVSSQAGSDTSTTTEGTASKVTNSTSGPGQVQQAGTAALQAIKRHTTDFSAAKELTVSAKWCGLIVLVSSMIFSTIFNPFSFTFSASK